MYPSYSGGRNKFINGTTKKPETFVPPLPFFSYWPKENFASSEIAEKKTYKSDVDTVVEENFLYTMK